MKTFSFEGLNKTRQKKKTNLENSSQCFNDTK